VAHPFVTVGQINLKPLVTSAAALRKIDPEAVLRKLRADVMKRVKNNIMMQTTFSTRARAALSRALKVVAKASSIQITANHPAFRPLLMGREGGQMRWLVKARAPIPIITEEGELIFRSATPRSMKNGKWIHPGHEPTTIIEKARKEAREHIKKAIKRDLQRQVAAAFRSK
jgi:hypothetical protein